MKITFSVALSALFLLIFIAHLFLPVMFYSPVSGWFPVPIPYSKRFESLNQFILVCGTKLVWSTWAKMWDLVCGPRPFLTTQRATKNNHISASFWIWGVNMGTKMIRNITLGWAKTGFKSISWLVNKIIGHAHFRPRIPLFSWYLSISQLLYGVERSSLALQSPETSFYVG